MMFSVVLNGTAGLYGETGFPVFARISIEKYCSMKGSQKEAVINREIPADITNKLRMDLLRIHLQEVIRRKINMMIPEKIKENR